MAIPDAVRLDDALSRDDVSGAWMVCQAAPCSREGFGSGERCGTVEGVQTWWTSGAQGS